MRCSRWGRWSSRCRRGWSPTPGGRRRSYLLGAGTLLVSTLLYLFMWRTRAPFWGWALASVLLGLGFRHSLDQCWRNPRVRWLMLAAPFSAGVSMYAFYALQPYLLQLYGDQRAFGVAGLAAALIAGTQIVSGFIAPFVQRLFTRRTHALLVATVANCACLALLGVTPNFWVALAEVVLMALTWFVAQPLRQAYLNGIIPSAQRATVLSFDNLMGSAGGVVFQPALGRAADVWGYARTYWVGAIIQTAAVPFLVLARREGAGADTTGDD